MQKLFFWSVLFSLFLAGCSRGVPPLHHPSPPVVTTLFKTEPVFQNPESVLFDPVTRQLLVSNVNGHPLDKDGNGFISKVSLNGDIRDLHWVTGLHGPKGMTLIGDLLYIADIDQMVIIDITNKHKTFIPVENAVFLNDVTHDESGRVFISDMFTNTIHVYHDGVLGVWLKDDKLNSPNGLHCQDGYVYVGSWGQRTDGFSTVKAGNLLRVDLVTREITDVAEQLGNLDGVAQYAEFFLVTDYMAGRLLVVNQAGTVMESKPLLPGSADLCVLPEDWELCIVPMMHDNYLQGFTIRLDP